MGTFGSLGALLGHSWRLLGAIGGTPGMPLGTLWHSLGLFGLFLGPFCALLWRFLATFGWLCASSGFLLGCFGELLASFWAPLDVIVDTFGRDAAKLRKYQDFLGFPQLKDTRGLQK